MFNKWMRREIVGMALVALLGWLPERAVAQTPTTYTACYIPDIGAVYRIGEAGLPAACLEATHVEFSWTTDHGLLDGLADDDHPEYVREGEAVSGDLAGDYGGRLTVIGLRGRRVDGGFAPSPGNVLTWNDIVGWVPAPVPEVVEVPSGVIVMWAGSEVPDGWALCDGTNGTPDLRHRFVYGALDQTEIGATGGESQHRHGIARSWLWFPPVGVLLPVVTFDSTVSAVHMPPFYMLAFIMKL